MASSDWKATVQFILMKVVGVVLALVFLALALFCLLYPAAALLTAQGGREAKVTAVSDHWGRCRTGTRVGGVFSLTLSTVAPKGTAHAKAETFGQVYAFYPAWPDQLQPIVGDPVLAWPAKKPLLAMPSTEGWGWFLIGTVLVVGLILLEFAFLALTLR